VIGAAFVSLVSSWFTGGRAPDVNLGLCTVKWVDWWLGVSFVRSPFMPHAAWRARSTA